MYSVRWVGFGISQSLTKSVLHFFPTSANVTAPYPVQCKVEIFSSRFGRKSLLLDGARLNQPDGIKLDAAFPILEEGANPLFGISLELSAAAQRVDISPSQCFIELIQAGSRIRFRLKPVAVAQRSYPLLYKDDVSETSLVVVNNSEDQISVSGMTNEDSIPVAAQSVVEIEPTESFFADPLAASFETELTTSTFRSVKTDNFSHPERAMYIVQRELGSKKLQQIYPV